MPRRAAARQVCGRGRERANFSSSGRRQPCRTRPERGAAGRRAYDPIMHWKGVGAFLFWGSEFVGAPRAGDCSAALLGGLDRGPNLST